MLLFLTWVISEVSVGEIQRRQYPKPYHCADQKKPHADDNAQKN
jgi:hypothetical protein